MEVRYEHVTCFNWIMVSSNVARMVHWRGVSRNLEEKSEVKRQLGRSRRRWEDNIKMDLMCG